jgi:uncharacterized protein (TIGR02265 family)
MSEDVVLAFPAALRPVKRVRSTLVMASIESIRQRGRFEDYERALPAAHKEALLHVVAATWVPLEAARAHYAACDSLGLSAEQQVLAGRTTFEGARSTLMGTAIGLARGAGVTPWQVLPMLQRMWDRGCDGGGVMVVRTGPKDAHIDLVQCELLAFAHFRTGLRGLVAAILELVCTRAYVTERRPNGAASVYYRVQWA